MREADRTCMRIANLQREKIPQKLLPRLGEYRFRMKLHAFHLVLPVPQSHDDPVFRLRGNLQLRRQRFSLHNQRMISRCRKRICQLAKHSLAVVLNLAGLPVKKFGRADYFPAKRRTDRLVSQANTQNRKLPAQFLDKLHGNPCLLRRARPGRDHDAFRLSLHNLLDGNLVVAMHLNLATQLAQILRQVVGKRVVVVQQQNHLFLFARESDPAPELCAASSDLKSAFDLFTDSSNSPRGVESATIPPPACTWATPFLMTMVRNAMHESRFPAKSRYKIPPA